MAARWYDRGKMSMILIPMLTVHRISKNHSPRKKVTIGTKSLWHMTQTLKKNKIHRKAPTYLLVCVFDFTLKSALWQKILYERAVSKSQTFNFSSWNLSSIKLLKTWLYLCKKQKLQTCHIHCKYLMILCLVFQWNLPNWHAERLLVLMPLYCGDFGQRSNISYFTWHPFLHKKMPFPIAI